MEVQRRNGATQSTEGSHIHNKQWGLLFFARKFEFLSTTLIVAAWHPQSAYKANGQK